MIDVQIGFGFAAITLSYANEAHAVFPFTGLIKGILPQETAHLGNKGILLCPL
jgi:hypothetical protein